MAFWNKVGRVAWTGLKILGTGLLATGTVMAGVSISADVKEAVGEGLNSAGKSMQTTGQKIATEGRDLRDQGQAENQEKDHYGRHG